MANSATVGILRVLLSANAAEFETAMKTAQDAAKKWGKDLQKVGQQATQIGTALTKTLTLPLVGLGGSAIKMASDFESSFAGIRKTVSDATDELGNLTPVGQRLAQGMRDLAKEIPVNVNELNRIGEAAGQLGIKSENILEFTQVMAKLGVTTNLSSDQAATALARLANITQMPQDRFEELGNVIVHLGNNLATTESEIVEFGLRIAGAGHQVGLTEGQILAFGGALSSVGISAEAGGTAISKVFIEIASEVSSGGKNLEKFATIAGMTVSQFKQQFQTDAAGAVVSFVEGLGRVREQGGNVFGVIESLGMSEIRLRDALLRASGAGDLLRQSLGLQAEALKDGNALTKEAEQRFKTFENQLALVWAQIRDVGITLGTSLLPIVRDMVQALQPAIAAVGTAAEAFARLPEPVRMTVLGMGAFAAAAGPVIFAAGQVTSAFATMLAAIGTGGIFAGAAKGIASIGVAAMAAAPQLAAFTVAAGAVVAIGTALRNAVGLYQDRQEQANLAAAQAHSHQLALAAASQVAGHAITDLAEAHRILAEHNAKLRDAQLGQRQAQQESTAAAVAAKPPLIDLAKILSEAGDASQKTASKLHIITGHLDNITRFQIAGLLNPQLVDFQTETGNAAEAMAELGDEIIRTQRKATSFNSFLNNTFVPDFTVGLKAPVEESEPRIGQFFRNVFGSAKDFGMGVSDIFAQAFMGGGGAIGAVKAFATNAMSNLLGMIPGIGPFVQAFAGPIIEMFSKLIGKAKEFFRTLFGGPSQGELNDRALVQEWEDQILESFGRAEDGTERWERVLNAANRALSAQGYTAEEIRAIIERLWKSSQKGGEETWRVVDELNRMLQRQRDTAVDAVDDITDAISRVPRNVDIEFRTRRTGAEGEGESGAGYRVGTMGVHGRWFQRFALRGTPTVVHGEEAIITPQQAPAFAMDVIDQMGGRAVAPTMPTVDVAAGGGTFQVRVPMQIDGHTFAEALVEYIPSALKRRGV